jgi:hypothetical protein
MSTRQGSGTRYHAGTGGGGLRRGQSGEVRWAKYADQDNFIPFILETGGRVHKAARDWLDALTAPKPGEQVPSQDDHPWSPQTRTTTETVLREAMQALVRVQAHMLARIVVVADIAVELDGTVLYRDVPRDNTHHAHQTCTSTRGPHSASTPCPRLPGPDLPRPGPPSCPRVGLAVAHRSPSPASHNNTTILERLPVGR